MQLGRPPKKYLVCVASVRARFIAAWLPVLQDAKIQSWGSSLIGRRMEDKKGQFVGGYIDLLVARCASDSFSLLCLPEFMPHKKNDTPN